MVFFKAVVILLGVGFMLWLINAYMPMNGTIKRIFNIVVIIAVVMWLLKIFGVFSR